MYTYKFHRNVLQEIISHIATWDIIVTSMTIDGNEDHTIVLQTDMTEEQFAHLHEIFQLERI